MKIIGYRVKRLIWPAVLFALMSFTVINAVGWAFDCRYLSVFAAIGEADDYQTRSRLLMEAMDEIGACRPEDAAEIWASGLKKRSAALQYSVMDERLKAEYARQLETSAPNWVTGISSPWVDSYKIQSARSPDEDTRVFELVFSTATSTGPYRDYRAELTIAREDCYWRITKIRADEGLYVYTRFNP